MASRSTLPLPTRRIELVFISLQPERGLSGLLARLPQLLGGRLSSAQQRDAPRLPLRCLTFELSRDRRQNAGPALQMMNCTVARGQCFAVGARLE